MTELDIKIGNIDDIVERFKNNSTDLKLLNLIEEQSNVLFTQDQKN